MRFLLAPVTLAVFICCTNSSVAATDRDKIKRLDNSSITVAEIDQTVERLMKAAQVTGLEIAILNDSKVAYVRSFG